MAKKLVNLQVQKPKSWQKIAMKEFYAAVKVFIKQVEEVHR